MEDAEGKAFAKVETAGLRRIKIPSGIVIRDVEVVSRELRDSGVEYINFSPYGGVERAAIHIMHENHKWVFTLATKPMSGRVAIFDHDVEVDLKPLSVNSK